MADTVVLTAADPRPTGGQRRVYQGSSSMTGGRTVHGSSWWWRAGVLLVVVGIGTAVVVADDGLRSEVHAALSNLARALF